MNKSSVPLGPSLEREWIDDVIGAIKVRAPGQRRLLRRLDFGSTFFLFICKKEGQGAWLRGGRDLFLVSTGFH